ncbi:MAG: hypothetical protein SNJ78_06080 [Spirochaetales bacterium]
MNKLPLYGIVILFVFASCSGRYPKIQEIRYRWVFIQETTSSPPVETLSIAIYVTDEDGLEDLEAVALVNDRQELYWKVPKEQWEWKSFGGVKWLVCSALFPPSGKTFPRGTYRVIVRDMAGYRAEKDLSLLGKAREVQFPRLERKGSNLILTPGSGSTLLVLTSPVGAILGSFPLKAGENPVQPILASPAVRTGAQYLYLYSQFSTVEGPIWVQGPYNALEFLSPR